MDESEKIRVSLVDGVEKTCLLLGSDELQPPKHMMQGEKQKGYILIDGEEREWIWEGLCAMDGQRYVYFEPLEIESFDLIATKYRDKALLLINQLALTLFKHGHDFASPLVEVFPTWRAYIVEGRGILVLPPDLGDLMSIYMNDEERNRCHGCYIKKGTEAGFSMIRQFGQLLYFALTGVKPFLDKDVREAGFHEIPLSFYKEKLFPSLSDETLGFINFTIHAKEREQRDIMGNRRCDENLSWFINKSSSLEWNVEKLDAVTLEAVSEEIKACEDVQQKMATIAKQAKRNSFWRQKGSIIVTAVIVVIVLASIFGSWLANLLEPPYTRDMGQVEIIQAFYQAQTDLNADALTAPLASGCDAPQETEVINLFITRQARTAYEAMNPHIPVDDWIEAGCPAIPNSSFIYGVTGIEIEQTGENTYHVTGLYCSPYAYSEDESLEEDQIIEGTTPLYIYNMAQDFTFTWNKRGWWNISELSDITVSLKEIINVETYDSYQDNSMAVMI